MTKDPEDRGSKYSGIGHTTSPYVACDRCGWARGNRPGAYKVSVKGKMTVKIVCHGEYRVYMYLADGLACADHRKRKGSERPNHRFGKNKEAKQFQKLMSYKKKDDSMDVDAEGDTETGGPAAPGIDDEKPT